MDVATSTVHIESPSEVDLEHQAEGSSSWEVVCESPCDRPLPVSGLYRINGSTTRTSVTFKLAGDPRTVVRVDPSSTIAHGGGILITAVGAVFAIPTVVVSGAVIFVFVFGAILVCPLLSGSKNSDVGYGECLADGTSFVAKGYTVPFVWGSGLIALPLLVGGGVLLGTSGVTRAEVDAPAGGGQGPGLGVPDNASITAKVRRPEWVTGTDRRGALTLPALPPVLPLVSGRF